MTSPEHRERTPGAPEDAGAAPAKGQGFFYGWWIVIAGGIGMSIASGINFHGFGNFIIPLSKEFGWSRTVISAVFSLARLESGLLGPIEGYFVDRIGPRRLMLVGIPLMGLGYILMSRINSLTAFFLVYVLGIALGNSLGMSTPMTAAVANWFNRKRGLAFGVMWSGVGLGGLLVPALGWAVERYGWRDAAMFVGIGLIAVGIPIASVMRHRPEQYGYYPDGKAPDGTAAQRPTQADLSQDFTAREALRTSSFWFLSLSITARSLVSGGIGLHLVPYFVGLGASPVGAAALAGSVGVMSIPGRFGLSAMGDFVDRRYVMAASLAVMTVAIVLMARATSISGVIPVLVVFSAAQGGISVIPQSLIAEYFGRRSYATIQGFRSSIQMAGIIVGPIISGLVFDATGSYTIAFLGFSGASVVSMVLVLFAKPPKRPLRSESRAGR
ncbi:MAG: MFS transporter [Chloroflexi bacterium]|nr:MFS transporter [Chloroflexota bacterium]